MLIFFAIANIAILQTPKHMLSQIGAMGMGHRALGIGHGVTGRRHGKNRIRTRITFKELV
ncbi:MAG: hypothetical protein KME38_06895 [Spirirestis rafaelensis WJT71-NPBG6]|nr:hypothetical protein [Spirirestis rafaelensis WJT71-NPBG6]